MKQTAVEWLIDYMKENFYLTDESLKKFEQAKKMEKEQLEQYYDDGIIEGKRRSNNNSYHNFL